MPKDLVYVFGSGSKQNDFEIQCSIASVLRYGQNFRDFIVIGVQPRVRVAAPIEFIPMNDLGPSRSANTTNKLRKICTTAGVSDDFVLMNDDFFLTKPVDFDNLPYYRSGFLADHIAHREHCRNGYYNCLVATEKALKKKGLPTRDFELHVPMVYNRIKLHGILGQYDFNAKATPLLRSMYCNTLGIEGQRLSDLKFDSPITGSEFTRRLGDRPFFSIGDGAFMNGSELPALMKQTYLYEVPTV